MVGMMVVVGGGDVACFFLLWRCLMWVYMVFCGCGVEGDSLALAWAFFYLCCWMAIGCFNGDGVYNYLVVVFSPFFFFFFFWYYPFRMRFCRFIIIDCLSTYLLLFTSMYNRVCQGE